MGELARHYDELLRAVPTPEPLQGTVLDSPQAYERRDEFFTHVKQSLEVRLSALAIESCITIERIVSPALVGEDTDISDELTLHAGQPLAYVLHTREYALDVVRFGVMPINRVGEHALRALEEADGGYSDIIFRG